MTDSKIEIYDIIDCEKYFLKPKKQIIFDYHFNDELQCYETDLGEFKHFVFGDTVEELRKEIIEEIKFMWESFVLEYDVNLTPGATKQKYKLLELFDGVEKI